MRHICFVISIFVGLVFHTGYAKCVAFYYWNDPPVELLYSFDIVVVDPDNVDKNFLNGIETYNKKAKVLGYISIGEIEKYRKDFHKVKEEWLLGTNRIWGSYVADIRNKEYRDFLIDRIKDMYKLGFDGVFLDTIDSYQLIFEDKKKKKQYEEAIVSFVKRLKTTFPDKLVALNRGFEIFDQVKEYFDIFVVENLFTRYDSAKNLFKETSSKEQKYLLDRLKKISKEKDVVVIEYVNPGEKEKAAQIIKKIKELNFIPYVSNLNLNIIGYSECTPQPRRALLLYNSEIQLAGKKDPSFSNVHRLAQLYIEYYGLVPVVKDINEPLPDGYIADRYRAIVVWIDEAPDPDRFFSWIKDKIDQGIKVVFIDSFGFPLSKGYLDQLGLNYGKTTDTSWELSKSVKPFEVSPPLYSKDFYVFPGKGDPFIVFKNSQGQLHSPVAVTEWGGYALEGYFVRAIVEDFFVINPFEFFAQTLDLPLQIVPDTTTESGKRILFVHIDGDGFNQKTQVNPDIYRYASEVIKEQIIKRFNIPHSVSLIEGEIAPWGAYPDQNHQELEKIARDILLLPNVEPASHSFSHPFDWYGVFYDQNSQNGIYNLNIKGYRFDLKREIKGSVSYIEDRILNKKKKVNLFFWTGDCMPPKQALKLTYDLKLYNINGGDTYITGDRPILSLISPLGINKGRFFQVYAQIQNDNIYTNSFAVPYGYRKVIETFILTDRKYRLKPIDIYYHFFSGSLPASLRALKEVYMWALRQDVISVYTSDFIKTALDFRTTTIVEKDKNVFLVKNNGDLRTLRVEKKVHVDLIKSKGVAGYRYIKGRTYISLDGSGDYRIVLTKKRKIPPFHLVSSNSRVEKVNIEDDHFSVTFSGYQDVYLRAIVRSDCTLRFSPSKVQIIQRKGITKIKTKNKRLQIDALCRK